MFESSLDIFEGNVSAIEMITTIAVAAVLIVVVAGFCQGSIHVNPNDMVLARFGGV